MEGHEVIVVDNFFTGQKKNIEHWLHHPRFTLVVHDVTEPIMLEVDEIYHLACPASPPHYQYNPVKTIKVRFLLCTYFGVMLMLISQTLPSYHFLHPSQDKYHGNHQHARIGQTRQGQDPPNLHFRNLR